MECTIRIILTFSVNMYLFLQVPNALMKTGVKILYPAFVGWGFMVVVSFRYFLCILHSHK
jgi:hypothetical protein